MTGVSNQRIRDLADEAAECIESCGLEGDELADYIDGMMHHLYDEVMTGARKRITPKPKKKGGKRAR